MQIDQLSPQKIYDNYIIKRITKRDAFEQLISLFEYSSSALDRVKCLELFDKLDYENTELFSKKIYKIYEYSLISDDNWIVRITAAKIIAQNFYKESLIPLKWAIQHDKSPFVLKTLIKLFNDAGHQEFNLLLEEINIRLENMYEVIPEEAMFLFELELARAEKEEAFDVKLGVLNQSKMMSMDETLFGDGVRINISNRHVIALNLSEWKEEMIPPSICSLSRLKHVNLGKIGFEEIPPFLYSFSQLETLDLRKNKLTSIPNLSNEFKSLVNLNLKGNPITEIPDWLFAFSKEVLSFKYVEEGVKEEEAPILGLLEILVGEKLKKADKKKDWVVYCKAWLYRLCYCCGARYYTINEDGHVLGIYLSVRENLYQKAFPEHINSLKYLKEYC